MLTFLDTVFKGYKQVLVQLARSLLAFVTIVKIQNTQWLKMYIHHLQQPKAKLKNNGGTNQQETITTG